MKSFVSLHQLLFFFFFKSVPIPALNAFDGSNGDRTYMLQPEFDPMNNFVNFFAYSMANSSGNNTSDKMSTDEFSPQPPVTEQQKELAQQAMAEFEKGQYSQCAKIMSQLAGARPTDVKVVLNRSVALFYQSQMKQVDEFRHNIHTVFNMVNSTLI